MNTLYWHDYETFGGDPRRNRPSQFAGIRTDEDLNIVGDPLNIFCKPAPDFLPDPVACAITGIAPQEALEKGVSEAEFCARIHQEFMQPGTCAVGYNSIRFDDEVTRHLFYRCFYDAYEREWKNGNSRWDIIDLVRMTHALRPEGIKWPKREDGLTSFRLEELTKANSIGHESAHDALSDVIATIEMAKLIKREQPKLYDFLYQRRFKQTLWPLLNPEKREPVLHVSGMFPGEKGCMAVVIPLMKDPVNQNGVIVYDLSHDPSVWMKLDAQSIRERLFTPKSELPDGVDRIPLKTVHVNKCPAVAPLSVLDDEAKQRWKIDMAVCKEHLELLESAKNLEDTLTEVFAPPKSMGAAKEDPDFSLYGGSFFSNPDKSRMEAIHAMLPGEMAHYDPGFQDARLPELLFRLRARNWPESLKPAEQERWHAFRHQRLIKGEDGQLNWNSFWTTLAEARHQFPNRKALLDKVGEYALDLGKPFGLSI